MTAPARSTRERLQDTMSRLEHDVDVWVSTADPSSGTPYLVPLSFLWDENSLVISTPASSPTSRNLQATGRVRLGIGETRDVVLIEGVARALADPEVTDDLGAAFAVKTGFDPRELTTPYQYFRISPQRVQTWREANELEGRDLMRGGRWVVT